jgi:hypothetical protein
VAAYAATEIGSGVLMGSPTFTTVAATDGPPQLRACNRYLLVHAIVTFVMFIVVVFAAWVFVASIIAPPCPTGRQYSMVGSTVPGTDATP